MDTATDPILSPAAMCADGGFSKATWYRHYRDKLEEMGALIWLSPRRCGARQSDWRSLLHQQSPLNDENGRPAREKAGAAAAAARRRDGTPKPDAAA